MLAHGLDAVDADMQFLTHLRENVVAAVSSSDYFAWELARDRAAHPWQAAIEAFGR